MKNKDLIAFPKEDNWNKFDYNFRIFDALASLFHFKSACSGVFKGKDDVLHLSYNTQVIEADTLTKKQVELVNLCIHKGTKEQILSLYLLLNIDYGDFINNQIRHENNNEFKQILIKFQKSYKILKVKLKVILNTKGLNIEDINEYQDINEHYYKLIEGIKVQDKTSAEVMENLFRPLQDSYKIHHYFNKGFLKFNDIKILDNHLNLHTECNIIIHFSLPLLKHFKFSQSEIDYRYIGIAKLCCGFCDKYLDMEEYNHRGTHGVCDGAWKMYSNPFDEIFKAEVLGDNPKEIIAGKEVFQHRRLSFDGFEEEIPLQLKGYTNLAELKTKLDLIYIPETPAIAQTTTTATPAYTAEGVVLSSTPDILADLNAINLGGGQAEFSSQGL